MCPPPQVLAFTLYLSRLYSSPQSTICCVPLCFVKIIEMALGVKDYKTSLFNAVRHGSGAAAPEQEEMREMSSYLLEKTGA